MPEFNDWFPTSSYGVAALNVMSFGAFGDGAPHDMNSMYGSLAAAQADYPSATGMSDTADWCAIMECFKQAFTGGTGVPVGSASHQCSPVYFPHGQYLMRKPLTLHDVSNAHIFGSGNVQLYNETVVAPNNVCFAVDGLQYSRIENIAFQSAGGEGSIAFDLNKTPAATLVNTNGNLFINCSFSSPQGVCVWIGRGGSMGSEMTFIRCNLALADYGFIIDNWNALNYQFLACAGQDIAFQWIRVNTGGCIVVQNASLAANGEGRTPTIPASRPTDGCDVWVGAGTAVFLACRTESQKFVRAGYPTAMFSCSQNGEGNDMLFADASSQLHLVGCETGMGRLTGSGQVTIDACQFNYGLTYYVYLISAGASNGAGGNLIRITHADASNYVSYGRELWLDGDEIEIVNVASSPGTGATSANGVWTINKISHNQVDLQGSTFVAATYDYSNARIQPGPRFHLRDFEVTLGAPKWRPSAMTSREPHVTKVKNFQLMWADSGTTLDNLGATAEVVFTLPSLLATSWGKMKGTKFTFIVLTAQTLRVQVVGGDPGSAGIPSRIFRAGGYATAGTNISSNVVGNSVEIYQADSPNDAGTDIGHRWLVRTETGTWTIAGTPA